MDENSFPFTNEEAETDQTEPSPQFRGFLIHADVVYLVYTKKLTKEEAWFLSVVDMFVDMKGIGCWATNRKLSTWCGVSIRQLNKTLAGMRKSGFVIDKKPIWIKNRALPKGGEWRRVIETRWSRLDVTPKKSNNSGAAHDTPPMSSVTPPMSSVTCPPCRPRHPYKNTTYSSKSDMKTVDSAGAEVHSEGEPMGFFDDQVIGKTPLSKPPSFVDKVNADYFYKAVSKFTKRGRRKERDYNEFRLLREAVLENQKKLGEEINHRELEQVLDWYCRPENLKRMVSREKYFPVAEGAKSFRLKFKLIKAKMRDLERRQGTAEDIVPSTEAKAILVDINVNLPEPVKSLAPKVIEVTLQNFRSLRKKLREYVNATPETVTDDNGVTGPSPHSSKVRLARYFLARTHDPRSMTFHFLMDKFRFVAGLDSYGGKLMNQAWRGDLHDEKLVKFVLQEANKDGTFKQSTWTELAKEIA